MSKPSHFHPSDAHGVARLAADATVAVTHIVEAMHEAAAKPAVLNSRTGTAAVMAAPRLAYTAVRGVAGLLGAGLDLALPALAGRLGARPSTPERDAAVSIVNGVVGDHLAATGNPLAITMQLRRRGVALVAERRALEADLPRVSPRIALLVHGLCGTDAQWKRAPFDYGSALEREHGFTPVYLRYNSGLHVSANGRALAALLEDFAREWPVAPEEILLVGHSMGGLVARSALHHGALESRAWPRLVRRAAFLGTPHHGAPLERGGNWFEEVLGAVPLAAPLSSLGRLRSAGVTDLRHGNLLDEDWQGVDRFERTGDRRRPVPLPEAVDCLAVAATTGGERGDARDRLVGDGLVPVASALGHHRDPERELGFDESRRHVLYQTHHMGLLGDERAYRQLARMLQD